jgi:hypothetical protein
MKKIVLSLSLLFFIGIFPTSSVTAQCPMCKMSAESNLKNGGTAGKKLNTGILYMLATPYLIIGTIGFIWWRNRIKEQRLEETSGQ